MAYNKLLNWREHLQVHPAADLFRLMSEAELRELCDDIQNNGLQFPITLIKQNNNKQLLLDGRNRLDAMEMAGFTLVKNGKLSQSIFCETLGLGTCFKINYVPSNLTGAEITAFVISANIHRRYLTAEQKRELT